MKIKTIPTNNIMYFKIHLE